MEIREGTFKAIIKPNANKNEIKGYDEEKKAYIINIKERAEDNKANMGLVKFLSKCLGRKIRIKSGFKSRTKIIETYK